MYVPVIPKAGCQVDNCHNNVSRYISYMGGDQLKCAIVHRISNTHRFYIYHSVWRSESGDIIDITPYPDGREMVEIFFISKSPEWRAVEVKDSIVSFL